MPVLAVDEVALREPRLLVPGLQPLGLVRLSPLGRELAGRYGAFVACHSAKNSDRDLVSGASPSSAVFVTRHLVMSGGYGMRFRSAAGDSNYAAYSAFAPLGTGVTGLSVISGPLYEKFNNFHIGIGGTRGYGFRLPASYEGSGNAAATPAITHYAVADYAATDALPTLPNTAPITILQTSKSGGPHEVWHRGKKTASQSVGSANVWQAGDPLVVSSQLSGNSYFYGVVSLIAIFGGALPDGLASLLSSDPFLLVEPA